MSVYISKWVRKLVIERAGHRCEYCRIPQLIANYEFHVEHIIGLQHDGPNSLDNLANCCPFCNWKKGPNLGSLLPPSQKIVPLFHPRKQNWFDHFRAENGLIIPLTNVGKATSKLLEFNLPERVEIRAMLSINGLYP